MPTHFHVPVAGNHLIEIRFVPMTNLYDNNQSLCFHLFHVSPLLLEGEVSILLKGEVDILLVQLVEFTT